MLWCFLVFATSKVVLIEAIDKEGRAHKYATAEYTPGKSSVQMHDFITDIFTYDVIKSFKITREDGSIISANAPRFDKYVSFKFFVIDVAIVQFEVSKSYRKSTSGSIVHSKDMQRPITDAAARQMANTEDQGGIFSIFRSPMFLIAMIIFMMMSRGGGGQQAQGQPAVNPPAQ